MVTSQQWPILTKLNVESKKIDFHSDGRDLKPKECTNVHLKPRFQTYNLVKNFVCQASTLNSIT
jgi:hypothetical protein